MDVVKLKGQMRGYALAQKLRIPSVAWKSHRWGLGARTLAWRVSGHYGKPTTDKAKLWAHFNKPAGYVIRHDYKAYHHSGSRPASAIRLIVLHDMEVTAYTEAAEAVGRYFATRAAGGSTQYGVDNDSIQQYLSELVIPWGAPYANTSGIHIEQMGRADWTSAEWRAKAQGTLDRTAWLIAQIARRYGIPLRTLTDAELRAGGRGVTTHKQCTRVFHVAGGHTDPGDGYPLAAVLAKARRA